jgi:hypothetical protein
VTQCGEIRYFNGEQAFNKPCNDCFFRIIPRVRAHRRGVTEAMAATKKAAAKKPAAKKPAAKKPAKKK